MPAQVREPVREGEEEMKGEQLSLFSVIEPKPKRPTWEDVQKGRARHVPHEAYSKPCRESCFWYGDRFPLMGELSCYLFSKPIRGGMCPSTGRIEWNEG